MGNDVDEYSSIEKLKDSASYEMWKFQISIFLKSKQMYEVVTGDLPKPTNNNQKEADDWNRKDATAQKMIITTIDKQPMTHLLSCKTSKEMFDKLKTIYENDTEQQKCALLQLFYNSKYVKDKDMATYICEIKNIVFKLNSLKQNISDTMLITKIIAGLPDTFNYFVSAWESTQQRDKTLDNLTTRLISEEKRIKNESSEDQVAFASSSSSRSENKSKNNEKSCFTCGESGHFMKNCPRSSKKQQRRCSICKKTNHKESDCFYRNKQNSRNESNTRFDSKNSGKKVAFFTEEDENSKIKSHSWILDSGATSHMTNNREILKNAEERTSVVSTSKKKDKMEAKAIGSVESEKCVLKDVIYVPDLSKNLLSVNKITQSGGEVLFKKDEVKIYKDDKKIVEGKKNSYGVYEVTLDEPENETLYSKEDNLEIWHKKLGHVACKSLKKLKIMSNGFNISDEGIEKLKDYVCTSCLKGKQTRKPFKKIRTRASRPLEILHTDLCGPFDPESWDGMKYFITILDDYTHYVTVHLLKGKYEANKVLKEVVKEYEAKWNLKTAKIRCDNGKEYINEDLKNWCKNKGIVVDCTIPYTPQLNGKSERMNRTLLDKARTLILDAEVNKEMWGEAVRVAAYLTNRMPTESLNQDKTPYEMWNNKKPDLKYLEIFGTIAYAKKLNYLKKLDERSEEYMLVGYASNGYRLFDQKRRKIIIARDVIVDNSSFTKQQRNRNNSSNNWSEEDSDHNSEENQEEDEDEEAREDSEEDNEDNEDPKQNEEIICQQRKRRQTKPPKRLEDYVYLTFEDVLNSEDSENGKKAIDDEIHDKDVITNRWIFNIKNKKRKVCRLNKALYGLKQAPVQWNRHFTDFLKATGLTPLKTEQCLFKSKDNDLILAIYVDDGLILGKDPVKIDEFLKKLRDEFKMTMYEDPKSFLGINIDREESNLRLHQEKTALQVLQNFNMADCSGTKIPLSKADISEETTDDNTATNFPYREAVGSLLYLTNKTRPDLCFSVNYVSRHMENPTKRDVNNIKHILKYLKNTPNLAIKFETGNTSRQEKDEAFQLTAYSDADYAEDKKDRRSTTGYIIFLNEGPIAWGTRKQPIVALSTTEAEYIAAAECTRELLYLKNLLEELENISVNTVLKVDNKSAIDLAKNGILNRKSKHIDVRFHFINEKVTEGFLEIEYCNTNDQLADMFTKPLECKKFEYFRNKIMC